MMLRSTASGQFHFLGVHLENLLAAPHVGQVHRELPVEAARTQQRGVEYIRPVGGGDDDDAFLRVEAVHLDEQRVEGLLALVVAAAQPVAARAAYGVDLVDEHQAGCALARLLEHVTHAARADADEHLHKVGAADAEEGGFGFAGDGFGQQRFAGARRADHQDALGDFAAELLEFFRVTEELNYLGNLLAGFIDTGDVLERDFVFLLVKHPGLALAEVHRATAGAADLPDQHKPDQQKNQQEREHVHEKPHQQGVLFAGREPGVFDQELLPALEQPVIERERDFFAALNAVPGDGAERGGVGRGILNVALDLLAAGDPAMQGGEIDLLGGGAVGRLADLEQHHDYKNTQRPKHP